LAVRRFGRFRKRWAMLEGLARAVLIGPGALLAWFLVDWLVGLPAWPLLASFLLALAVGAWALAWRLVRPMLRRIRTEREALIAESLHGALDNQLIGALQLGREIAESAEPLGYSPNLVHSLVARTAVLVAGAQPHGGDSWVPRPVEGRGMPRPYLGVREAGSTLEPVGARHASPLPERGTPRVAEASIPGAVTAAVPLDLRRLVDLTRARRRLAAAGTLGLALVGCLLFAQDAVARRADRLRDAYATVLDTLFPVEMRVGPGDIAVVRGRPVTLTVEVVGARRRQVQLSLRGDEGRGTRDVKEAMAGSSPSVASPVTRAETEDIATIPSGLATRHAARGTYTLPLVDRKASFEIASASESFRYSFAYGRRRTAEHRVLVGDRPEISAINYEIAYPAYTGQPPRTLVGRVPKLQALIGTNVLVSFAATTDLHPDSCMVEWQDGSKQAVAITGRFGHFSFTVDRPDRATLYLTGAYGAGFEMERPLSFEVAVQRDEPPSVQVLLRQKKLTMLPEEAAAFGLRWLAEDDFGVAEAALEYRIDTIDKLLGRPTREGSLPRRIDPPQERVRGEFLDFLKTLSPPLQPGDRITITVSAKDNNTETGPGLGRSRPVEIVVVRQDLSGFVEKQFGFGSQTLLSGLSRVKRETDLLVDPVKTVRTEAKQEIDRQTVKSRVAQETWPSGAEDATSDYFRLLSGRD